MISGNPVTINIIVFCQDGKEPKDMITDDRRKKEFVLISEKYSKPSRDITTVSYFSNKLYLTR